KPRSSSDGIRPLISLLIDFYPGMLVGSTRSGASLSSYGMGNSIRQARDSSESLVAGNMKQTRLMGRISGVVWAVAVVATVALGKPTAGDWSTYLGDAERSHYSELTQINRGNAHRLQLAWTFR